MSKDVTIAICSIRNPTFYLKQTLDEIARSGIIDMDYEILVYGPTSVQIPHDLNPIYVTETFQHGNIYGYNLLASLAQGRQILFLTDDMSVPSNLEDAVHFMDQDSRTFEFYGFGMHDGQDYSPFPDRLILPNFGWHEGSTERILEVVKNRFGAEYSKQKVPLVRFLAASKRQISQSGYLFHPAFRNGGGDQWMSIFCWSWGQPMFEDLPVKLEPRGHSPSVLSNLEIDGETLRDLVLRYSLGYYNYV